MSRYYSQDKLPRLKYDPLTSINSGYNRQQRLIDNYFFIRYQQGAQSMQIRQNYASLGKSSVVSSNQYQLPNINNKYHKSLIFTYYERQQQFTNQKQQVIKNTDPIYGYFTQPGSLINGISKINQDNVIIDPSQLLFGVADGHGQNGERVSGFLRMWIPRNFDAMMQYYDIKESFIKSFQKTNQELWNSKINTNLAGSTLVCILLRNDSLYCANVGDSRAVMGTYNGKGWESMDLSNDQKPSEENEAMRIIRSGGKIHQQSDMYGNGIGPLRVWMKNGRLPGLAMTRSFGDKCGAQAGVIAIPEVKEYKIKQQDKFIIIASDGVWEFQSSQKIVEFVGMQWNIGLNLEQISQEVVKISTESWKENSLVKDDITCLIVQLNK